MLAGSGDTVAEIDFVCECAEPTCLASVSMTPRAFGRACAKGRPLVVPGHRGAGLKPLGLDRLVRAA
jgi:hypothetical protein